MFGRITKATSEHSDEVANLVTKLLQALVGHKRDIDFERLVSVSRKLLSEGDGFHAFLYQVESTSIGVITVSQSAAIYAGGHYGVIEELYVEPEFRSKLIGKALLGKVVSFAREQGWPRLEVSTPEKEHWQRTIDFYRREGFVDNSIGERLKFDL
ncbi:N-acetyltransferase [Microbulbifer sp. GL-2]|uniref:GNAT family N-acetyltransferase n=1 Tax=Microbulbifer sp. GL-2 TaxID=2591606 RepID=UPI0011651370|nr:GNAT family N-acetyltransferase [Microbulbifer sp. GL-2]BBM03042.1 hypothetical protein GL2_31160 [Microbulbifer sp. GL-2]